MVKEWFMVKEYLELPGVPGSAPAVRLRLNTYSGGKEGVKRSVRNLKPRNFIFLCFRCMYARI